MSNNIYLKKGLDLPISGEAAQSTKKVIVPDTVAIKPTDFRGLVPKLLVREGDQVLAGTPVLADKMSQNILFTSPVSGVVDKVVRGEKRKLLEVRIKADAEQKYVDFGTKKVEDTVSTNEEFCVFNFCQILLDCGSIWCFRDTEVSFSTFICYFICLTKRINS